MEIMLMAKFMEIVSSVVIYMCVCVCVCVCILFIYLFTLCQQLIVRVLSVFIKN